MRVSVACFLLCCLSVTIAVACVAENPRTLVRDGDRVVFLGDSITQQRIYTRYVMNYFSLCRPGARITFRNAGIDGDRAPGGLARLQRDVLSLKPTLVTICFGMNDGNYQAFDQAAFDKYASNMAALVSELKRARVKVVLLSPGIADYEKRPDWVGKTYNDTLRIFADAVMKLGKEKNVPAFNLNTLMADIQSKAKKDDPAFTLIPDGIHPGPAGHAVMAYGMLKMLVPGGIPCSARIDTARRSVKAINCKVSDLKATPDSVTFTKSDKVLPTYLDPEALVILEYFRFYQEVSPYQLTIAGLKSGQWRLAVEGQEVGTFTALELSKGVELAALPGPWRKIGQEVNALSAQQEDLYFRRWRNVSLAPIPEGGEQERADTLKKLDAEIDAKESARIQRAAGEHRWTWALTRVTANE